MEAVTPHPLPTARDDPGQGEHENTVAALRERVKELDCLYAITRLSQRQDMALDDLLAGACAVLVRAWQHPGAACARATVGGCAQATANWHRPASRQESPIRAHGEVVGRIEVGYLDKRPEADEGPFLREERHLLDAVAEHLGRIIEARKNEEHLRQLSRELIKAQETERQRLARELHDDVAQNLALVSLGLDRLAALPGGPAGAGQQGLDIVRESATRLGAAIASLRHLAGDLLPPMLNRLGLAEAAAALCRETAARTGIAVECTTRGLDAWPIDFEAGLNLYRVLQEGLANACRHGRCTAITVRLTASHPLLILRIDDDGQGFDPEVRLPEARAQKRMGLWSMGERLRLLGGRLTIRSRPGHGVRITAVAPAGKGGG
ncbi:sensor histidine kinase [Desulfovibrio aerotolerans]|uniref:Sensor histidine kinase n=1 Tax=Solidesulfovibrio aerotolerans TaxID=295255 RepID=A0A7C9IJD6_9BACT|nr:sensor histidine kinase [Solidesulfovibrio aerotolerans]MYL81584.1 sensor histidine kinase [Solidesulfovibrio aerotolerans]